MKQVTYKWCSEHAQEYFNGEIPKVYYVISESLEVHKGNADDCNLEYCKEHNIPVYDLGRCGGTIVCNDGTIGFSLLTDVKHGWRNQSFLSHFTSFLQTKGLNPEREGNDILLDGYKVASAAEWKVGKNLNRVYGVYLISYDVDIDAIQQICKKPMKKIPKALRLYGLDKEEIINWCKNYFGEIEKGN